MKSQNKFQSNFIFLLCSLLLFSSVVFSQTSTKDKRIIKDSKLAKAEFIKADKLMSNLFDNAYGYVIFPNVGKGGFGVGGASGKGAVYQRGNLIGTAQLTQITVGFQAGGQSYREVIFFESEKDLNRFKENNIELSAQASAVAVTEGAAGNAKYKDGVMIFSHTKGGLMYEASIGGQTFKYRPL
jgi:lipid-binding SYLF domain-containing protein